MKITISNPHKALKFATIIQHLKHLTENVSFYFRDDGLYIQCMDDNHCCLFECSIKSSWFDGYNNDTGPSNVGIAMSLFNKVINARHDSQTLELEVNNSDENHIYINFVDSNQGKFNKHFKLSLINIDYELMEPKQFETIVDLTMDAKTLCELVNQLMIFDENLSLTFNEDSIDLISTGSDGSMKVVITLDDVKEYAISENMSLTQSYSLKYILVMCQFNKLSSNIIMGFSNNMPMTLRYDFEHDSWVIFHLAPKIVDE
jgi:proliferating cell nuclear antigen PCNA